MLFIVPVISIVSLFSIAFLISFFCIPWLRKLAYRINFLDIPQLHKTHKKPIPYMGGVAIYLGFISSITIAYSLHFLNLHTYIVFATVTTFICSVGLYDDYKGMPAKIKLLAQIMAAIYLVLNGIVVERVTNPFQNNSTIELGVWGYLITVSWLVGITNSINLLDGLDGLAAGVSAILLCFILGFALFLGDYQLMALIIALLGGVLAFLFFNFPPATIFMGDTGSLLIGLLFAAFCIMPDTKGPYALTMLAPAMLTAIPVLDTLLAIFRRAFNGYSIFVADKHHLHHRILNLNSSYKKTLFIIYGLNTIVGLFATATFLLPNQIRLGLILVLAENIIFGVIILRLIEKIKKR